MMTHQTVTDLVAQVKLILEGEFRQVSVIGEISNLSSSSTGHYYFTLSDKESSISAALFRGDALRNPLVNKLKNGDKIFCQGGLGVYAKRGTFQLIVKNMAPVGAGDLKAQYEALKLKLQSQGLFDPEVKKPIPQYPRRVAVITARGAAALHDFVNIYRRRSIHMDVVLLPSLVQGDAAPAQLVKALRRAIAYSLENPEKGFDAIVLTRGGGSLEDLWAFNDEALAWEIFNCPIPVISAVGHQVDYTLVDYVSDFRAETPSAAAEVLTTGQFDLRQKLQHSRQVLAQRIEGMKTLYQYKQKTLSPRSLLGLMRTSLQEARHRFDRCDFVHRGVRSIRLEDSMLELDEGFASAHTALKRKLETAKLDISHLQEKIQLLNPRRPLEKGFTYVEAQDGSLIRGAEQFKALKAGTGLCLTFVDGQGEVYKK
jgi:exodeoxyribonuclease VII large subunit